jgi:fatty acid desaturase
MKIRLLAAGTLLTLLLLTLFLVLPTMVWWQALLAQALTIVGIGVTVHDTVKAAQ